MQKQSLRSPLLCLSQGECGNGRSSLGCGGSLLADRVPVLALTSCVTAGTHLNTLSLSFHVQRGFHRLTRTQLQLELPCLLCSQPAHHCTYKVQRHFRPQRYPLVQGLRGVPSHTFTFITSTSLPLGGLLSPPSSWVGSPLCSPYTLLSHAPTSVAGRILEGPEGSAPTLSACTTVRSLPWSVSGTYEWHFTPVIGLHYVAKMKGICSCN